MLQYYFATSKPLKTRLSPKGCRIAPLRNRSSLFVVVFFRFCSGGFIHSSRRSYYLFCTTCSYYLYGEGFSPKERGESEGFSPKCAGGE